MKDGKIVQSNFPNYRMVMMNTMPHIELHIMESDEERGGVGEPGTPPIAPAADECNLCCVGRTYSVAATE